MRPVAGQSLLELLWALAGAVVTAAALAALVRTTVVVMRRESLELELRETQRRVLERIVEEIRMAGWAPLSCAGCFTSEEALGIAEPSRIELRADRSRVDGRIDEASAERVGFRLDRRGRLLASIGNQSTSTTPDDFLRRNGLEFRYFDVCGDRLPARALGAGERRRVHAVEVWMDLSEAERIQGFAWLRNRRGSCAAATSP